MKLSIKERYAIQALAILATERPGTKLRAQEIAEREGIPRKFLEQVLLALRKAGLVESSRGREGGYVLAERPERVTLRQVLGVFKGPVALIPCLADDPRGGCPECRSGGMCWMRAALAGINEEVDRVLDQVTLADLAEAVRASTRGHGEAYMYYI